MPAPEIAVAYVSIVPSLSGFQQTLRRQILPQSEQVGEESGNAMGGGLRDGLKAGAAAAALAAGVVIVKGLTDAIEQAKINKVLRAQLGSSAKDAARHGKIAGKLFTAGVTDNFQEGADAIRGIMQAGIAPAGATNRQLQSIATKASDVATVFGQDLGGVTNAVGQMMKTGLAKNSGEAFDLITRGFQTGTDKGGDFLDTINEYGTQFRKAGLDGATSIGLMNQAIRAGARDSDIAADAIKEFSIRAVDGSKLTGEGFSALGLNATDMAAKFAKGGKSASGALDLTLDRLRNMKDPVERSAAATALFGTQAEDLGDALFAMDPSKAASGLGKVGGAAEKVGKTIRSGPMQEIRTFVRELQEKLVGVMTAHVLPAIASGIGALKAFGGWVQRNSGWILPLAAGIGAMAGAFGIYVGVMKVVALITRAWAAAQAVLNVVMAANPIGIIILAIVGLGAALVVAYKKSATFRAIVQGAWAGIKKAVSVAWNSVIKPVLGFFMGILRQVGKVIGWLWKNVASPYFKLIGKIVGWLYNNAVKPIFALMMAYFRTVGSVIKWLYRNAAKPAFNAIAKVARWLWNNGVKPHFEGIKRGVKAVGAAFNTAKDYIGKQWKKLSGIARKPIQFIVDTVYNKGIVGVWNKVAGAFGAPKLRKFSFASGGIMPGYTPGRDPHKFYSPTGGALELSGGEAIMRPEVTRALGVSTINRLNGAARAGGVGGVRSALGGQAFANGGVYKAQKFANGGVWGWIKNASTTAWDKVKAGASWLKDGIKSSAMAGVNSLVRPLIRKLSNNAGAYSAMVKGIPNKMISSMFDFSGKADKKMAAAGIGGKGTKSALRWARTQHGKRYQWGGNGNPSWDCSGFTSAIENVIRGQKPHRSWSTHAFKGGAPAGWVRNLKSPYQVGITHNGVGHVAGTLNGVNVESRGGDGVVVGPRARGANSSLFQSVYGFAPARKYDSGGWLQPGATMSVNKTGKPEPILTSSQWSTMSTLAGRGVSGGLQPGDRLVLSTGAGTDFEVYVDDRAGKRIESELTAPAILGRTL